MTYECELSKQWSKEKNKGRWNLCGHCFKFMSEADCCLEDSMFTPLMYQLGKKTKSTTFWPNDYASKEVKKWFALNSGKETK